MKKFFMFLAVAGLMTFTANIASAQDEEQAAPAATEEVAAPAAEETVGTTAPAAEEIPLHQALKSKFIDGGPAFMSLVLICLILGLALAIERILYLAFSAKMSGTCQLAASLMEELRASKDPEEIRSMIAAQRISETALEETLQIIRPGMTEKEIAAEGFWYKCFLYIDHVGSYLFQNLSKKPWKPEMDLRYTTH